MNFNGDLNTIEFYNETNESISISYAELYRLVLGNCSRFLDLGVRPGEQVAFNLKNSLEHVVTLLALLLIGAIPVSLKPPRLDGSDSQQKTLDTCRSNGIRIAHADLVLPRNHTLLLLKANLESTQGRIPGALMREQDPDDVAFIQFSSGSTSEPKAIPITIGNLATNLVDIVDTDFRNRSSVFLNYLPLCHDMGLVGGLLSNLFYRNKLLMLSTSSFVRNPWRVLELIESKHVEIFTAPNFAVRLINRCLLRGAKYDLQSLQSIYCGSEPIQYDDIKVFNELAAPLGLTPASLIFCYGLAEATLLVTSHRFKGLSESFGVVHKNRPIANVGTPPKNVQVTIAQATDTAPQGNIVIRGESVFPGYLHRTKTQNNEFITSDLGIIDERGDLFVLGRVEEIFIVNGENIFPNDIEAFVVRQFDFKDALAINFEERLFILAIAHKSALNEPEITKSVLREFGIKPTKVIPCKSSDILRTSSGKPKRADSLLNVQRSNREIHEAVCNSM